MFVAHATFPLGSCILVNLFDRELVTYSSVRMCRNLRFPVCVCVVMWFVRFLHGAHTYTNIMLTCDQLRSVQNSDVLTASATQKSMFDLVLAAGSQRSGTYIGALTTRSRSSLFTPVDINDQMHAHTHATDHDTHTHT